MQNLEADDKAQGISHANTNSSHPNQFKRFVSGELTVQHCDRLLLFAVLKYCSASLEESGFTLH